MIWLLELKMSVVLVSLKFVLLVHFLNLCHHLLLQLLHLPDFCFTLKTHL